MAIDNFVRSVIEKALWDPKPTETDQDALYLAEALGYPVDWRVVRSLDGDIFVDRIYPCDPATSGCDMWFSHAAAMEAAGSWEATDQTPFSYKGGDLLPLKPLFDKGDKVQVFYEDEWWDAKILKRKEYPGVFRYQVFYGSDNSKQNGVEENEIRPRPTNVDPEVTAAKMGFPDGWKVFSVGNNKYKIISAGGETFKTKKAAMEAVQAEEEAAADEGDPPWRTEDNEYLGRRVKWVSEYKVSARRTVELEQFGTVTGWISENDLDSEGEPGFVSEITGQPARLYHIKFDEDKHHTFSSHFLTEQDVEEFEIVANLVPDDEGSPKKKARKGK